MRFPNAPTKYDQSNEQQFRRDVESLVNRPALDEIAIGRGILKEVNGSLVWVFPDGTEQVLATFVP